MSKHTRTSRRRRIALGLGATGGGLLAAAFMPMGIALAAPAGTDPGSLPPFGTDTGDFPSADPFSDGAGTATALTTNADTQLNIYNGLASADFDYALNHAAAGTPLTTPQLDTLFSNVDPGINATVPPGFDPEASVTALGGATDLDPFSDTTGLTAYGNGAQLDYILQQLAQSPTSGITAADVAHLDALASGDSGATVVGTLPTPTDADPAADFVQLFDPHAFVPTPLPGSKFRLTSWASSRRSTTRS